MRIFCIISAFAWVALVLIIIETVTKRRISNGIKFESIMLFGMELMIIIGMTIDKAWIWNH